MMKIAIFVEGQTEDIFLDALRREYFGGAKIEIRSVVLQGDCARRITFATLDNACQYAEHVCLIVGASGGEAVLSRLKHNYARMRQRGFSAFFGLRDLKSDAYDTWGEARVVGSVHQVVNGFKTAEDVYFHFAKMTTEAWFLAAPSFFARINSALSIDAIERTLGMDLQDVDPETDIHNPTGVIKTILDVVGLRYGKSKNEVHRIVSRLDWAELCLVARQKSKISFFFRFLDDLDSVIP